MCYYSGTMRKNQFRDAIEGEDMTLRHMSGHQVLAGKDGKAVCIKSGSTLTIEKLEPDACVSRNLPPAVREVLAYYRGKTVTAEFREYQPHGGYAADAITLFGQRIHIVWLAEGLKCYLGPKRVSLETKLGVDDPSIVHDHKSIDEMPTLARALGVVSVCSITR